MLLERIRMLREDADLKQETLAAILNVKQTTYSKYELGKISIPIESLITLARYYHTSIDYLVGMTDERTAYPASRWVKP